MPVSTATRIDHNRHLGTELPGLQLGELDEAGIAEIRRLAAERGVLVFREQHMTLDEQIAIGRRLGELHVHPAFADPKRPEALRIHARHHDW